MANLWFICKANGDRLGPFTSRQLREMAERGELLPEEQVWREGLAKPARASKVQGLFAPVVTTPASLLPQPNIDRPVSHLDESMQPATSLPQPEPPEAWHNSGRHRKLGRSEIAQRSREFLEAQADNLKRGRDLLGAAVGEAKRLMADAITEASRSIDETEEIALCNTLVFGRSSRYCDWLIPHPTVAIRHFEIAVNANLVTVQDLGTDTGTFVNGTRVPSKDPITLTSGDTITAGPYVFQLNDLYLRIVSKGQHAHLICIDLSKDVTSHGNEGTVRILNRVTLEVLPGEFVVLIGPSGSGKSTLMNALSGRSLATSGDVLFNEQNLYANFDSLKRRMSIVPQIDLLHDRLSLKAVLSYTADLRMPADVTAKEKQDLVATVIHQVEMAEKATSPIATYSGGQVKRASLAIELLSNPSLLFIDEVTSSLDEHSDREMMHMFRKLADDGKTIVCITHNLGHIMDCAHTIVVMAQGGYLAFVGTPVETLKYFSISDLGQLYQRLKNKAGAEWASAFSRTQKHAEMAAAASKRLTHSSRPQIRRAAVTPLQKVGRSIRHLRTTARRNIALQLTDRRALLVAALQPLLVGLLIVILFGPLKGPSMNRYGTQVLFLLCISAFWFGCNNAAKEIVKERSLFEKERNAGLDAVGYLMSKFLLLALFTAFQSMFLLCFVTLGTGLDGSLLIYGISLFFIGLCGVALGLAISTISSDSDVAATAVPLAIIPQVILAGSIKPVEGLSQFIAGVFAPCYWCFGIISKSFAAYLDQTIHGPMWSQQSQLLSLFMLCAFTTFLIFVAILYLTGIKIVELAKPAELELWFRSTHESIQPEANLDDPVTSTISTTPAHTYKANHN